MYKIINLTIVWLLIILELGAQNTPNTKTETFNNQLIYLQVQDLSNAKPLFELIDNYVKSNKFKVSISRMFPGNNDKNLSRIYKLVSVEKAGFTNEFISIIEESGLVSYVEYAPIDHFFLTPNDLHANQWHLPKIMAENAWGIRTGGSNIKLAIVDDAVDINHEDLNSVMYVNADEIANNGIDDDNNGYIDDRLGWNSFYNIGNPNPPYVNRNKFTHGTHCAGISAAATNNGIGIASIGYNISIIPVSCSDSTMPGRVAAGYEGIVYAVDAGANVVSLSWGGSFFSQTGQTVINYAISKNVTVVAAAGNDNSDILKYPAAYNGVISVAATDNTDTRAYFSNFGTWVDISAPGVQIWSTITGSNNKYDYMSGTSMACPLVAGLCGLMLSQNDRLTPSEIEACLKSSADNIDGINSSFVGKLGSGRINAQKALQCIKPIYADFSSDKQVICPGGSVQFLNKSIIHATQYLWKINGAIPTSSNLKNPNFTFPNTGKYNVKLVVSDGVNSDSIEYFQYIEVKASSAKMVLNSQSIKKGESAFLSVQLNGKSPWSFIFTDGTNNYQLNNVQYSPYYFDVNPQKNTKYFLISMNDTNCSGPVSDTTTVFVDTTISSGNPSVNDTCGNITKYTKTIDFGSRELPHFIVTLRDGNVIIGGLSNKGLIGGEDIFLTKFKPNGSRIWTKYYGTTANEISYPLRLFDDKDHNLYICGASYINNPNTSYFAKLDSSGSIIYTRNSVGNGVQDQVLDGMQLSNGNIMYVGTSAITSDQAGSAFVMDNTPSYIWKKSYNTGGQTEHNVALQELNKKIYVLGRTSVGSGNYGTYMVKMNLDGQTIWQKYIDYPYYDAGMYEVLTDQSSIMTVQWLSYSGSSMHGGQDIGVYHCDTNGNRIWSRIIGTSGKDDASGFVKLNGNYYISGVTNGFDGGRSKLFLIKLDINGNLKWAKIYGAVGETITKPMFANHMTVSPDGSLMILAQKLNSTDDVLLYKIDQCGNSNCPNQTVTFNITPHNTSFSNANFGNLGILGITNSSNTMKVSSTGITISDKCPQIPPVITCGVYSNFRIDYKCMNDSARFIDSSYSKAGSAVKQVKWIFHDNTTLVGYKNAAFKYSNPGSYKIKYVVFSDTPNMCSDTFERTLVINNKMSSKILSGFNNICSGDSIALSIQQVCGKNPFTIQWYPAQYVNNPMAFNTSASPPSSMWIKYIMKDAANTVSTDSVYVNVSNGCCAYKAEIAHLNSNYCLNDSVDIIINKLYVGANYKWHIFLNGNLIDSINASEIDRYVLNKPGLYKFVIQITGSCKKSEDFVELYVHPLPLADAGKDSIFCDTKDYKLGNFPIAQHDYNWSPKKNLDNPNVSNPTLNVTESMTYVLTVKDNISGCISMDSVSIEFGTNSLNLGNDTTLCEGSFMYLYAGESKFETKYLWSDGYSGPNLRIGKAGRYYVQKTNVCGVLSDTINIFSKLCFCRLILPNAFSPDANAINEYFPEEYIDTFIDITIFNRWGEMLFKAENVNKGWDGRYKGEVVQQDVYLYIIKYRNCYGRYEYIKGTFTLLR